MNTGLVPEEDVIYTTNRLLELFQLEGMEEVEALELEPAQDDKDAQNTPIEALEGILKGLLDYACEQGMIEDSITYRDLFDTKIMSVLMPRPSEVIRTFWDLYKKESPQAATEYYYNLSRNSDYIRR